MMTIKNKPSGVVGQRRNPITHALAMVLAVGLTVALSGPATAQTGPQNLVLTFENLAPLDEVNEGHYEGWAILAGEPISTGKFNIGVMGEPVELGGGGVIEEFDAGQDITEATDIVITVEPPGDEDPAPSDIKLLAAPIVECEAGLLVNVPERETLEMMTTGSFILATPSDNPEFPDNDNQGIWFLRTPGPEPGFENLPDIGPNWIYEGWVVDVSDPNNPVPYSTGTFTMAEAADSDSAGCNGGGPPFPGQDFVESQCEPYLIIDTGDYAAVISIEPQPDDVGTPFQLKPLAAPIPTDAVGQNNDLLNQTAGSFPTGLGLIYCESTPADASSWGAIKSNYREQQQ